MVFTKINIRFIEIMNYEETKVMILWMKNWMMIKNKKMFINQEI